MSTSVFCIVPSEARALDVISRLRAAGFSSNDVSVLLPDRAAARDFAHETHTKAPEGATAGAGAGGVLGGALGWIAGIGALAIPGLGPFIAAGPIMAALSGAALGAAIGGVAGALVGMGMPELEAKRYETKIKDGNILISVHSEDHGRVKIARQILESSGASDISMGTEKRRPPPDVTIVQRERARHA